VTAMQASTRKTLVFVLVFSLTALAQFAVLLATPVRPLVDGFSGDLAAVSAWLIHSSGGNCLRYAAVLSNPARNFAMEVRDGCNGINVVVLLWSAILAYPASLKWRLLGVTAGLAAIQSLNLFRLISLFYLGQYNHSLFEFAHEYLWELLIIIDGIVVFNLWTRQASKRSVPAR
jgi:exosortase H (IPTLxxWG-CTERM-specific)